jgi:hypothetical protein
MFTLSGLGDLLRPFGLDYLPFEQIFQLGFGLYCGTLILIWGRVNTLIFVIMFTQIFIALASGLFNGEISQYTVRTFYIFLMPVVTFSAGSILRTKYSTDFEPRMNNMFTILLIVLTLQGILYVVLYKVGIVSRLGNSIPYLVPLIYLCIYRSRFYLYLMPFSILFNGKRITALVLILIGFISIRKNLFRGIKKSLIPLIFLIAVMFYWQGFFIVYFERWNISNLFDNNLSLGIIDKLSSGRIGQWLGGIATIDTPFKFFWGSGSGTIIKYVVIDQGSTTADTSWYVHNAAISYFVQTGIVGFLLLFFLFSVVLIRAKKGDNNSFSFYYFWLVLISIPFSANLLVNPIFWFFAGALYSSGSPNRLLKFV